MDVGRVVGNEVKLPLKETPAPKNVEWIEDTSIPEMVSLEEVNCTLHISDEGYRRWEQSRQEGVSSEPAGVSPTINAVSADAVDESAEEEEMSSTERLSQFADMFVDVMRNTQRKATKETDDEKVAALEQMRQLKEEQEEEYQRQVKEAQAMAVKQTKTKNIVEKGMRDLTIMLESFKPLKDDEKKDKRRAADKDTDTDTDTQQEKLISKTEEDLPGNREEMLGIGNNIRRQAYHAEYAMDDTLNMIFDKAQSNFLHVWDGARTLREQLADTYTMMQEDEVSDAEKDEAVRSFLADGEKMLADMRFSLMTGKERMYNLKLIKNEGLDNQNMVFAKRAQDAVGEAADQSALDGLYQEGFESMEGEAIEELAKHIRDLVEEERMSRTEDIEKTDETDEAEGSEIAKKDKETDASENMKELEVADASEAAALRN